MTPEQRIEQHVDRLTEEHGYHRQSWGFRAGVRDGLVGDFHSLFDPNWPGYRQGFKAGRETAKQEGGKP